MAPEKQADKVRSWLAPHLEAGEMVVAAVQGYTQRWWGQIGFLCMVALIAIPIGLLILITGHRTKTWGIGLTEQRILVVEEPLRELWRWRPTSGQVKSFPLQHLAKAILKPGLLLTQQLEIVTDRGERMRFDVPKRQRWEPEVTQFDAELRRLMASG